MSFNSLSSTRRELLAGAAAAGVATMLAGSSNAAELNVGSPFSVSYPQDQLDDLRRRVAATRWPDKETVADDTQGVQLDTVRKLADYWADDYDWRKVEARLNALPQFIIEIDGLPTSISSTSAPSTTTRCRSSSPMAGPGSIIEQLKIIEPLTDPTAHGGSASDAFDVVIPSLPGYGFSGKPTAPGWTPTRIAKAWATLMQRLGYTQIRGPGRRLGQCRHRADGAAAAARIAWHPHQHGGHRAGRHLQGARRRRRRRRPACRPTNSAPGTSSTTSTRTGWAMRSR